MLSKITTSGIIMLFVMLCVSIVPCYGQVMRAVTTVPYTTVDSVDFNALHAGVPIISVTVNGQSAKFMFDTGTSNIVLNDKFAKRIGLTRGDPVDITDALGNKVLGQKFDMVTVQLGIQRIISSVYSIPADFSGIARDSIDGILGMNSIEGVAVLMSPASKTLTFYVPGNLTQVDRSRIGMGNASAVPLTRNRYDLLSTMATFKNNSKTISEDLTIDTGSQITSVNDSLFRTLNAKFGLSKNEYSALGGNGKSTVFTLDELSIGQVTINNPTVVYTGSDKARVPSLLGRDVLSKYHVLIDSLAMTMYLLPSEIPLPPQTNGTMRTALSDHQH